MNVLIACEYSGIVRDAFTNKGHHAVSCDLIDSETPGPHYKGDVFDILDKYGWDLVIAHPPCTRLCVSGARWKYEKPNWEQEQIEAIDFFLKLTKMWCKKWVIENPIGIMSSYYRKPNQIIQPWMFGHGETKATCLWLSGFHR